MRMELLCLFANFSIREYSFTFIHEVWQRRSDENVHSLHNSKNLGNHKKSEKTTPVPMR